MKHVDADKLCEALKSMASVQPPLKQSTLLGVVSTIENYPAADVVPRSEVDDWIVTAKENLVRIEELEDALKTVKAEAVREIFADIEKIDEDTVTYQEFYNKITQYMEEKHEKV